jgi:molybdopterin molybdotransferase
VPVSMDSVDEARAKMGACIHPLGCEPVALRAALDRTLREAPSAARDQPPFASSAMDGFAVRAADLRSGRLTVVGESAAGRPYAGAIGAGEAVRIFTGAPVPQGADRVVRQEKTRRDGAALWIDLDAKIDLDGKFAANIRAIAIDFKAGEQLIGAGTRLNPRHIALLAAAGVASVNASRVPRIALLATGSEIVAPGENAGPHQIYDSVTFGIGAMVEKWGGFPVHRSASPDEDEAVSGAVLEAVEGADLAVIAGGASVGDYDVVKRALASRGLEILVRQVAVRPGKPTWFGTIGSKPVLGLPGNPAAAFVCAHLFLRHLINRLLARDGPANVIQAVLDGVLRENPVESYLRAHASVAADARWMVRPFDNQDTSLVSVFAAANALIRRTAGAQPAAHGAIVEAMLLDSD